MPYKNRYTQIVIGTLMALGLGACGSTDSTDNNSSSGTNKPTTSTSGTIIHHGISYGIVRSKKTGRRWLDRNLGAKSVCDGTGGPESCYGDFYEW